jgi:multiple antibiotic resistance protein
MEFSLSGGLKVLVGMFVIVNPIGMIPFFLNLTENSDPAGKQRIARVAATAVIAVLVGSSLLGDGLLRFFGVSLPAFRVAGGILLLLMAVAMIQAAPSRARHTPEEAQEASDKENIAIVPLAIPLLAGPGSISTAILYANQAEGFFAFTFLLATCVAVGVSCYYVFRSAETIRAKLGKTGINIMTRLFGILLAAIGVEFIAGGLAKLLPGLVG